MGALSRCEQRTHGITGIQSRTEYARSALGRLDFCLGHAFWEIWGRTTLGQVLMIHVYGEQNIFTDQYTLKFGFEHACQIQVAPVVVHEDL
jgi:hypothetical protein